MCFKPGVSRRQLVTFNLWVTGVRYEGRHTQRRQPLSVVITHTHGVSTVTPPPAPPVVLTSGGASACPQKTSSPRDMGDSGDKGERAISDMELLWGVSRLERRLAFWGNDASWVGEKIQTKR